MYDKSKQYRVFAGVFIEDACPLADALQDRDDRLPLLRQRVFHPRRDLIVGLVLDQAVGDEELEGRFMSHYIISEWQTIDPPRG